MEVFATKETATLCFLLIESMLRNTNLIRKTSKMLFLFKIIYVLLIRFLIYLDYEKKEELSEISSEKIVDYVIFSVELKAQMITDPKWCHIFQG